MAQQREEFTARARWLWDEYYPLISRKDFLMRNGYHASAFEPWIHSKQEVQSWIGSWQVYRDAMVTERPDGSQQIQPIPLFHQPP